MENDITMHGRYGINTHKEARRLDGYELKSTFASKIITKNQILNH